MSAYAPAVGRRVDGDLGELLLDPLGRRAQGLRRHLLHGLRILKKETVQLTMFSRDFTTALHPYLLGVPPGPLPLLPRGPARRRGRPRRGRRRRRRARSRHHYVLLCLSRLSFSSRRRSIFPADFFHRPFATEIFRSEGFAGVAGSHSVSSRCRKLWSSASNAASVVDSPRKWRRMD